MECRAGLRGSQIPLFLPSAAVLEQRLQEGGRTRPRGRSRQNSAFLEMLEPPHVAGPGAKQQLLLYWGLRPAGSIAVLSCAGLCSAPGGVPVSPCPGLAVPLPWAGCPLAVSLAVRWKCCRGKERWCCPAPGSPSGHSQARVLCPLVTAAPRYRGEFLGWIHPRKRKKTPRRGSEAAARGSWARERHCLKAAAPQCAPSPRCCRGGKAQKPRKCRPRWPLRGRAGSLVSPGVSLGGCGCPGCRKASGGSVAAPKVGAGQPGGCQGAGTAAGAFLTRRRKRSCHHCQPAAESSLVHC